MLRSFLLFALALGLTELGAHAEVITKTDCEKIMIPTVYDLNLFTNLTPKKVNDREKLTSPAVTDTWLFLGRRAVAYPDFKYISDLAPRNLSEAERREAITQAKKQRRAVFNWARARGASDKEAVKLAQALYARKVIEKLFRVDDGIKPFEHEMFEPRVKLAEPPQAWVKSERHQDQHAKIEAAFQHVEEMWKELARQSPTSSEGSLIPSPLPVMVAGGRFRESYYWDSYFGAVGLNLTGRWEMSYAILENFLHMIQVYGRIPNGFRDYYLTRSQPPVVALLLDEVIKNAPPSVDRAKLNRWLVERAYPLLKKDYQEFWMKQRYDASTGLNFHSDDLNIWRPERHSNDVESELGVTNRDVRAEAESGEDHTDATMRESSRLLSVQLNAFLYAYENQLADLAVRARQTGEALEFKSAALRRKEAVNRYLWDDHYGVFRNYHLDKKEHAEIISIDMMSMLFVGLASQDQAERVARWVSANLERPGGLMSTTAQSGKQWDGNHGWAPFMMMAIGGLDRYEQTGMAQRLARKWVNALAEIYARTGHFYEKIDVTRVMSPQEDASKYPTQTGFLWTNASYVWCLHYLGYKFDNVRPDSK